MEFIESLSQKAGSIGLELHEDTAKKLALHWQLLSEANSQFNLTAIKDQQTAIEKHYLDCLIAATKTKELLPKTKTIADIGSGGGFPGLIMAAADPQIEFTLIESSQKKADFLFRCALAMELDKVKVLPIRAEDAGHDESLRESFDLVIARAVTQLAILVEYALPLAKPKGSLIAMKGPKANEEIEEAKTALAILGGEIKARVFYDLPATKAEYGLINIEKIAPTPQKYPRRAGIPEKRPLG